MEFFSFYNYFPYIFINDFIRIFLLYLGKIKIKYARVENVMYRSKDFILMDTIDINGRKIGFVRDVLVNFNKGFVVGFSITPSRMFKRVISVLKEDILTFNNNMIVKKTGEEVLLKLSDLKGMDVLDHKGDILGMVEDIIFDINSFRIKGLVISAGFIHNLLYGKKILLIKDLILGDKNILYFGDAKKICFTTNSHELLEVNNNV